MSDIRWALSQKDVQAVICNRGGYGTIRLIDKLSLSELRSSPKWLIGQQTPVQTGTVKAPAMSLSRRLFLSGKRD